MVYHPKTIPPKQRSAVSNGRALFLGEYDGRSLLARRFRDIIESISDDIGGDPSSVEQQLIRRAAMLSVMAEQIEQEYCAGSKNITPSTILIYSTISNTLRRLCETLGTRRIPRDVTPTLELMQQRLAAEPTLEGLEAALSTANDQSHRVDQQPAQQRVEPLLP